MESFLISILLASSFCSFSQVKWSVDKKVKTDSGYTVYLTGAASMGEELPSLLDNESLSTFYKFTFKKRGTEIPSTLESQSNCYICYAENAPRQKFTPSKVNWFQFHLPLVITSKKEVRISCKIEAYGERKTRSWDIEFKL